MAAEFTAPEGSFVYRCCSRLTTFRSLATLAALIGVLAPGSAALGQDENPTATTADDQIEEIIVTGSRIKRRDLVFYPTNERFQDELALILELRGDTSNPR